eukprot:CAMPEP_0171866420 /NCGR_PEP_ID=MMETSP0992-20121227/30244_1 /TAXON_ID=483369 /ORGANISM="non described non described, Strain CCMP2098" /LENGTH=34 /DNA_ID= /DNA_START= /DNA_END= /DNA_ORIENTATION=
MVVWCAAVYVPRINMCHVASEVPRMYRVCARMYR